jgi:hypothetical protein
MSTEDSSTDACGLEAMTTLEIAALAQRVLMQRAGPDADAAAVAAAARRASDELAPVLAPLIGRAGIDALAARTLHLAQRDYPWLAKTRDLEQSEGLFVHVSFSLEQQDPALAAEAAAAVLATFTGLLVRLMGEPLAAILMRQAWPDGFSGAGTEERGA